MNFSFHPSLEHIALVTISSRLWNQHDIRSLLEEFSKSRVFLEAGNDPFYLENLGKSKENWQKIEAKVNIYAAKLMMPVPLQKKILDYIHLIGLKILDWLEYHLKFLQFHEHLVLPSEFYFTPQGTIDKKKTAELLVRNDSINIIHRFKLASTYCLEDVILLLWNEIDYEKQNFYNVEELLVKVGGEFAVFWGYYLRDEMNNTDDSVNRNIENELSSYEHLFMAAAKNGNKAATEFFFKKMDSNKLVVLKQTAIQIIGESDSRHPGLYEPPPKEYFTEVICFLLSQLCHEDKIQTLIAYPLKASKFFLNWPWQNLFFRMIIYIWNFLPQNFYYSIFQCIAFKVCYDCKYFNYRKLFSDVWQEIPDTDKSYILNDDNITELLDIFLQVKDTEMIKFIFQDAKVIDKNKVILSNMGLGLCIKMICGNHLDLLSFFIKLLISSKKDMIKFKEELEKLFEEKMHTFPDNEVALIRFDEFSKVLHHEIINFSSYDKLSNEEM